MRTKILVMWDSTPWPKDHIYLCNVMEQEHEKLRCLVYPNRAGAWLWTKMLEGIAGVGKTTLATKVILHWVEGFLFQYKFSYVFYISCYAVREMEDTTFAGLSLRPPSKSSWVTPRDSCLSSMALRNWLCPSAWLTTCHAQISISSSQWPESCSTFWRKNWSSQLPYWSQPGTVGAKILKSCWIHGLYWFWGSQRKTWRSILQILWGPKQSQENLALYKKFWNSISVLFHSQVCSCLKQQMVSHPHFPLSTQTATSLYAYFFSSWFATAELSLSAQSWPEQWRALCSMAADRVWSSNFTFAKEDVEHQGLQAPLIDSLFRLNILQKVSDCEDCIAFAHCSFQVFGGPRSMCLGERKAPSVVSQSSKRWGCYWVMPLLTQTSTGIRYLYFTSVS